MKRFIVALIGLFLIAGCSSKKTNSIFKKDIEQKAVCKSKPYYVEEDIKVENKRTTEIYAKNNKITKMVMTEIYTCPTYDGYVESIAISYNRQLYGSAKDSEGIKYKYTDDYSNQISTTVVTYNFAKLTFAEKDEIGYETMTDDEGNLLEFKEFVEYYENSGDMKCTIEK